MYRGADDWRALYEERKALWIHDGNPECPHAELTSGKHSSGFFNSRLIIKDERLLFMAVADLIELSERGGPTINGDIVIGPQTGATLLAKYISRQLSVSKGKEHLFISPAKKIVNGEKTMVFTPRESELIFGRRILLCDDVLTTGGSVNLVANAINEFKGIILPFILVLVNRSGLKEINGRKIIALIDKEMPVWDSADVCPLCQAGSIAIRPKDNWEALNATY